MCSLEFFAPRCSIFSSGDNTVLRVSEILWGHDTTSDPHSPVRVGIVVLEYDFTKFKSFRANFLDSVSVKAESFFISWLSIFRSKSLWKLKGNMFPVRMILIRRDSIKNKYQDGSLTSAIPPKKLARKSHVLTLYRSSHSEDMMILDLSQAL